MLPVVDHHPSSATPIGARASKGKTTDDRLMGMTDSTKLQQTICVYSYRERGSGLVHDDHHLHHPFTSIICDNPLVDEARMVRELGEVLGPEHVLSGPSA